MTEQYKGPLLDANGQPIKSGIYEGDVTPTPTPVPEVGPLTPTPAEMPEGAPTVHVDFANADNLKDANGNPITFGFPEGSLPAMDNSTQDVQDSENNYIVLEPGQTYTVGQQVDLMLSGFQPEDPFTKGWTVTDISKEMTTLVLPASSPNNGTGRDQVLHMRMPQEQPQQ